MKVSTLPRYLLGSRNAILEVARSPGAIWCGVLLTISAGLAREYDGEDLLHEPWHALRPLGASLVSGTVLFLLVHGAACVRRGQAGQDRPPFLVAYRSFMSLFWMTAPLAWLYAVPYERFLPPADAVEVNLWTLALVAVWRVLLITRAISVVYGVSPVAVFFIVMLFADALVFAVVTLVPVPVIDVMGGLRHSERDALVSGITFMLGFLSVITAPVWIIGAAIAAGRMRPRPPEVAAIETDARPTRAICLCAAAVLVWVPVLAFTQPEQINRWEAEKLLKSGRVGEAFAAMSRLRLDEYPPHWDPPPRLGYRERDPDLANVCSAMREAWPAPWVADIYLGKVRRSFLNDLFVGWNPPQWDAFREDMEPGAWMYERVRTRSNAEEGLFLAEFDPTMPGDVKLALEAIFSPPATDPASAAPDPRSPP